VLALTKSVIAIVDDDVRVLESLENLLESYGYAVRPYDSATAFLQDDVLFEIDCLISDIGMPTMDGFELQARVAGDRPQLPVILITARNDVSGNTCVSSNNRGFLQKPFKSETLLNTVAAAIPGMQ
jgi:FixJ family two-component response regulator